MTTDCKWIVKIINTFIDHNTGYSFAIFHSKEFDFKRAEIQAKPRVQNILGREPRLW